MRITTAIWALGGVFVLNTAMYQFERLVHRCYLQRARLSLVALLLFVLGLATTQVIASVRLPATTSVDSIRQIAELVAAQQMNEPGVTSTNIAVLDERTRMPACSQPLVAEVFNRSSTVLTMKVHCDDVAGWQIYVPVRVSRKALVVITTGSLPAGTVLTEAHLIRQERDITGLPIGYRHDSQTLIGQILRRPLNSGQIVSISDVKAPARVRRGETVTLVARSGGVEARSQGKALADAAVDASIRVQNLLSHRIMTGRVLADGTIDILP